MDTLLPVPTRLDQHTRHAFKQIALTHIEKPKPQRPTRLVLDFTPCEMVNSAGLGTLVSLHKACRAVSMELELRNLHGMVADMFRATKMDAYFQVQIPEPALP